MSLIFCLAVYTSAIWTFSVVALYLDDLIRVEFFFFISAVLAYVFNSQLFPVCSLSYFIYATLLELSNEIVIITVWKIFSLVTQIHTHTHLNRPRGVTNKGKDDKHEQTKQLTHPEIKYETPQQNPPTQTNTQPQRKSRLLHLSLWWSVEKYKVLYDWAKLIIMQIYDKPGSTFAHRLTRTNAIWRFSLILLHLKSQGQMEMV